jgi:hypothetical protein
MLSLFEPVGCWVHKESRLDVFPVRGSSVHIIVLNIHFFEQLKNEIETNILLFSINFLYLPS